jgi:hypothetical protein
MGKKTIILPGKSEGMNVEHRTPNIERRMEKIEKLKNRYFGNFWLDYKNR